MIDTHTHYLKSMYNEKLNEMIKFLDLDFVINVAIDIETSKETVELSKEHKNILATIGIHPTEVSDSFEADLKELANFSVDDFCAIGEIGLDYFRDNNIKEQKKAFKMQLTLAEELNKPVIIHTRKASAIEDAINMLANHNGNILLHSWSGSKKQTKELIERENVFFSFNGISTFKNAEEIREVMLLIPIEKIMFETDSPWLSPEPLRGKENNSNNVKYIYENYSKLKKIDMKELIDIVERNVERFLK